MEICSIQGVGLLYDKKKCPAPLSQASSQRFILFLITHSSHQLGKLLLIRFYSLTSRSKNRNAKSVPKFFTRKPERLCKVTRTSWRKNYKLFPSVYKVSCHCFVKLIKNFYNVYFHQWSKFPGPAWGDNRVSDVVILLMTRQLGVLSSTSSTRVMVMKPLSGLNILRLSCKKNFLCESLHR